MIDHVNIVVRDLEASARFYEQVFGLTRGFSATLQGAWIEAVTGLPNVRAQCLFLHALDGKTRLELLQYEMPGGVAACDDALPNAPGLRHLAFEVQDLDALLERLHALNVTPISAPVDVPFQVANLGRKRLCYFRDPDGVLLEAAAYDASEA